MKNITVDLRAVGWIFITSFEALVRFLSSNKTIPKIVTDGNFNLNLNCRSAVKKAKKSYKNFVFYSIKIFEQ